MSTNSCRTRAMPERGQIYELENMTKRAGSLSLNIHKIVASLEAMDLSNKEAAKNGSDWMVC